MTRIARGIDTETLMAEPSLFTIVNANSPLQYDVPMLKGVIELARRGQVVCFTPPAPWPGRWPQCRWPAP